jgi:repressor LexA
MVHGTQVTKYIFIFKYKNNNFGVKIMNKIQQVIFDFIRGYPHQYSPTIREICTGVGLSSSSSVHSHLIKLEKQGHIVRRANCPRCIVLVEK